MSTQGVAADLYNVIPACLKHVERNYMPKSVVDGVRFLAKELPADGLKTLVIRPLQMVGGTLKFTKREDVYPTLKRLGAEGSAFKALVSGLEIFSKTSKMFEALAKRVDGSILIEHARMYKPSDYRTRIPGPQYTPVVSVASRVFWVANWFISVGDLISMVGSYRPLNKTLDKATPWIYSLAGGYMGAFSMYTEMVFAHGTWWAGKKPLRSEIAFSLLNMATYTAFLFQSAVGFLGLYHKGNAPSWLGKWQFATSAATVALPFAQKCAKQWMENNVWN